MRTELGVSSMLEPAMRILNVIRGLEALEAAAWFWGSVVVAFMAVALVVQLQPFVLSMIELRRR